MRRFFSYRRMGTAAAVLGWILTAGCGYQVGSLMHPQIQSIAVAPVVNETLAYNAAAQVRGILCEQFVTDGSLKLVNESTADCVLYARVTGITFAESSWSTYSSEQDDDRYIPNEWQVGVTIEYTVIIPGRLEPLVPTSTASGTAIFMSGPDMETSRTNGLRQAILAAGKSIVAGVTEAW